MSLASGTRLGAYELLGLAGAGGMGEVYKARDHRLDRIVAIKILPADISVDPERRGRFEREAKAVAALNHPNIVTIHAVEEAGGVPFFTMEYVDGRTLAQTIPPHGMPLDELLRIAIPLADAVGAAHQHGILHRDLKPANVMITSEGRVKVLDFGLAKLKEAAVPADNGPTVEATGEGRILGTVAYMSPEQTEGKPLDQRSDVFSIGVLLYEMATGQRPFKGDTSVSIISAILKDAPGSVTDLRPDLPRDLARILKRALNKDPEHRYQTAKDLRNDLEALKEDLDSGEIGRTARPMAIQRTRRSWVAAIVLLAIAGAAAATWWISRRAASPAESPQPGRLFADFVPTRLTTGATFRDAVAISPDGRYVAYVAIEDGRQALRVRQTESSGVIEVVPPADVRYTDVTFSPDGNRLYYVTYPSGTSQATLYDVAVLGGAPRRLILDVDRGVGFSPDGSRIAFMRNFIGKSCSILIANADGTGERTLVTREVPRQIAFTNIAWSADGRTLAATAFDGWSMGIVTVDVATGEMRPVGPSRWDDVTSIVWPRNESHLIIAALDRAAADTSQLWEVSLTDGAVRRVTRDIASYRRVSLTADARTLVTVRSEWRGAISVAPSTQPDRAGTVPSTPETVAPSTLGWTPDGRIVYTAAVNANVDIWSVRPDGSDLRQLTSSAEYDGTPSVSPDGRYIAFLSFHDGRMQVWRMDPDGGGQKMLTGGPVDFYPVVAADSRSVYFSKLDEPGEPIYSVPIDGGTPVAVTGRASGAPAVPIGFHPHAVLADGALLGQYFDEQEARTSVAVVRRGEPLRKLLPLSVGATRSFEWAPDGRSVTVVRTTDGRENIWRLPLDGTPPVRVTNFTTGERIPAHAWSPDGKFLALVRGVEEGAVVRMRDSSGSR